MGIDKHITDSDNDPEVHSWISNSWTVTVHLEYFSRYNQVYML